MFFNLNVHKTLWTKWHFAYYLIKYSYKPLVLTLLQIRAADNGSIGDRKRKMIENVLHLLNVIQITLDPLLMLSYYWRGPTTTLRGTKKSFAIESNNDTSKCILWFVATENSVVCTGKPGRLTIVTI